MSKTAQKDERIYFKVDDKELIDVCLNCRYKDCRDKICTDYKRKAAELRARRKAVRN